jgi:hypothetical protein
MSSTVSHLYTRLLFVSAFCELIVKLLPRLGSDMELVSMGFIEAICFGKCIFVESIRTNVPYFRCCCPYAPC